MAVEYLSENEEIDVESLKKEAPKKEAVVKPVLNMGEYSVIHQKAPPLRDRTELLKIYKDIGDMIESVAKKV